MLKIEMNAVTASAKPPTEISFLLLNSSLKKYNVLERKLVQNVLYENEI